MAGRALVVIVDDRTAHGDSTDSIGPLVTELLNEAGFLVDATVAVAADEVEIRNALNTAVIGGVDLVISVGGTGVSPRDVTPDVTAEVLDREIPGISRGPSVFGSAGRFARRGPLPRARRRFRQHTRGQPRVLPRRGPGRHGHADAARGARDFRIVRPGRLRRFLVPTSRTRPARPTSRQFRAGPRSTGPGSNASSGTSSPTPPRTNGCRVDLTMWAITTRLRNGCVVRSRLIMGDRVFGPGEFKC